MVYPEKKSYYLELQNSIFKIQKNELHIATLGLKKLIERPSWFPKYVSFNLRSVKKYTRTYRCIPCMHKVWKNYAFTRDLNQIYKCEDNFFLKATIFGRFEYYLFSKKNKMHICRNHFRVFMREWDNNVFYQHAKSLTWNTLYF